MKKTFKIIVFLAWISLIGVVVGIPTLFMMVSNDAFGLFGSLPSLSELERPDPDLSSELISADGVSLGKYYRHNRSPVTFEELSPELINTLLVTEDLRFKSHSGIDLRGLLRAVFGKLTFQYMGGGSTITMQLAENLFRTSTTNKGSLYQVGGLGPIITKLKEWIISVQLEQSYTKEEILAMYLNTVEYGSNSYGIKVASKTFFNKLPSQIDYLEAASLIGSINKPTAYNPVYNPERAASKRAEVLFNLYKYQVIERHVFDSLRSTPLELRYNVDSHNEGLATYFRTVIRNFLYPWADEHGYDLDEDGLKIYTTIDSRLQQYAEEAMAEHMDTLQSMFDEHWLDANPWIDEEGNEIENFIEEAIKRTETYQDLVRQYDDNLDSINAALNTPRPMTVFSWQGEIDTALSPLDSMRYYKRFLQAGFMAMDPNTGHIKAWVGGIDHEYFKYDHVYYGKRQPGSTFKPVVYTAAIDNGYSPCFPVVDAPVTFSFPGEDPPTWTPNNANDKFTGNVMTIRQAMARSVNSITAYMMNRVGPRTVVDYARRLGITSPLSAVPALCLGAGGDVSIYELVGAYATFVNKGVYTKPFYITRIEDQNGNVIQQFIPETREAINEETAYLMLHMLKGTTEEEGGSGRTIDWSLRENNDIGAKTGTTQNGSDGWFIGITKGLAAGAWVGGDDRSIHFRNWAMSQGARTAMPIWQGFMLKVYADPTLPYEKGRFDKPINPISVELDCNVYSGAQPQDTVTYDIVTEDDIF